MYRTSCWIVTCDLRSMLQSVSAAITPLKGRMFGPRKRLPTYLSNNRTNRIDQCQPSFCSTCHDVNWATQKAILLKNSPQTQSVIMCCADGPRNQSTLRYHRPKQCVSDWLPAAYAVPVCTSRLPLMIMTTDNGCKMYVSFSFQCAGFQPVQ